LTQKTLQSGKITPLSERADPPNKERREAEEEPVVLPESDDAEDLVDPFPNLYVDPSQENEA
jgi:hypothetical protein